jgi:tetratricopeptide (TPR) repeat protein
MDALEADGPLKGFILNVAGKLRLAAGDRRRAETLFRQAIDGESGCGEAFINLGAMLWERNERAEAFEYFEKGFLRNPLLSDAARRYQFSAVSIGELARAHFLLERLCVEHLDSRRLRCILVDILLHRKLYDNAAEHIQKAMARFGSDPGLAAAAEAARRRNLD